MKYIYLDCTKNNNTIINRENEKKEKIYSYGFYTIEIIKGG